jgi:hypothetical protein
MARFWAVLMAGSVVGCGAAFGQVVQVPKTTNMCPVTQKNKVTTTVTGPVQCPPGTYQVPNTGRCRVR